MEQPSGLVTTGIIEFGPLAAKQATARFEQVGEVPPAGFFG